MSPLSFSHYRSTTTTNRTFERLFYMTCFTPKANQVLPEMVKMLPFDSTDVNQTSEVTISLCEILTYLCLSDANNADAIIENRGIPKIINISKTDKGLVTLLNHSDTRHEKAYVQCKIMIYVPLFCLLFCLVYFYVIIYLIHCIWFL